MPDQLLVKLVSGKTAVIDTNEKSTVASLKAEITALEGCSEEDLVLVWHSKVLSILPDDTYLRDLSMKDLDTIHASFRLRSRSNTSTVTKTTAPQLCQVQWMISDSGCASALFSITEVPQTASLDDLYQFAAQVFRLQPNTFNLLDTNENKLTDAKLVKENECIIWCRPFAVDVVVSTSSSERVWCISATHVNFLQRKLKNIVGDHSSQTPAEWQLTEIDGADEEKGNSTVTYHSSQLFGRRRLPVTNRKRVWRIINWETTIRSLVPPRRENQTANRYRVDAWLPDFQVRLLRHEIVDSDSDDDDATEETRTVVVAKGGGCSKIHGHRRVSEWVASHLQPNTQLFYEDSAFIVDISITFNDLRRTYDEDFRTLGGAITFHQKTLELYDHENCAICLDTMDARNEEFGVLSCRHAFHWDCISEQAEYQNKCPSCRHEFTRMQKQWIGSDGLTASRPEVVDDAELDVDGVATVWCVVCGENMDPDDDDVITCYRCDASQHVGCVNMEMRMAQCSSCSLCIHGECLGDMNMFHDAVIYEESWECWRCTGEVVPEGFDSDFTDDDDDDDDDDNDDDDDIDDEDDDDDEDDEVEV